MNEKPLALRHKVYILGAGVSGLVSGWALSKHGWDVVLLEKEHNWGGLAATKKWDEFYLDFGPHIYHTVSPRLEELWEREFGDLFVKGEFWCKNVKGKKFDKYYDYPLSYEALQDYPPAVKGKIFKELKQVSEARRAIATNYKEYVRELVGPTLQGLFFENYPSKLWGLSTDEMTANWAPKRIELREKRTPFYTGRWNAVGKFGTGCVLDRIAQQIKNNSGRIILGEGVTCVEHVDSRVSKIITAKGQSFVVDADDVVISTLPFNILAGLFGIPCPLKFRGVICVSLAFNKEFILPEGLHFLYYDSQEIIFHRVSEQKKFSAEGFPQDKTFVTAEIAYTLNDKLDQSTSEALIKRVLDDLVRVNLVSRKDFYKGIVQKRPCVYPCLTRDYEHHVKEAQSYLAKHRNLYVVGGPAEYNYADIHINFLKAMDLSELLVGKYSDLYRIKKDRSGARTQRTVFLNNQPVGPDHKPFVIAEAGLNHNGDVRIAMRLVEEAKKAGCDAVKFQTYVTSGRVSNQVKKAQYAEQITGLEENIYETLSRLELSVDDHRRIFEHGRTVGIDVFSTPFDLASVDVLESMRAPFYKVASSDLNNLPLLSRIAATGKPLILSTGMSTLGEVEESVQTFLSHGNSNLILLHCLSSYPASYEELNLRVIQTLRSVFQAPVGFSDHTRGLEASITAVSLGADVIERHFTLDRNMEGPDHIFSSEPSEMAEFCLFVKRSRAMLGDGIKRIQPGEYETINSFKKTIYAKKNIVQGEVIDENMLEIKGPAGGLQPRFLPIVIGRRALRNVAADHPITWEDI